MLENDTKQPDTPIDFFPRRQENPILKWIKRIFTPLAVGFFVYFGWQTRDILATVFANAQFNYLILAILISITAHFVAPASAQMVLKTCGSSIYYQFALKIHVDLLPARYLPGGIWHMVGRTMIFYEHGIKPPYLTAFVLMEYLIAVLMAFVIGGMLVWYFRGITDVWGKIAALSATSSTLVLIILPTLVNRYILKSVGKISYHFYIQSIGIYVLSWFVLSLGFICYLLAFPLVLGNISLLEVGGTYLFSWAIGFISIFAPQGIGIFEVVAGHILTVPISLGSLAVLIAGFRVVSLIADVILWGITRLIWSKYSA
jgi:hypothetical protein